MANSPAVGEEITGGVDTHQDPRPAAVVTLGGEVPGTESFSTTRASHRAMLAWFRAQGEPLRVGVESTGGHGAGITRLLTLSGVPVLEVTGPDPATRRARGKDDALDAVAAAEAARTGCRVQVAKDRGGAMEALRVPRTTRKTAVKSRRAAPRQFHPGSCGAGMAVHRLGPWITGSFSEKRPEPEGTWTVRHHHTGNRPHVRGSGKAPRVRHGARNLTDGGGLVLVRKLFDRLALAGWIDGRAKKEKGFFRPGLMSEVWIVPLLERRGVRRVFGWRRVPDPTTFGRWLRRAGTAMVPLLDESPWRMVRRRWALAGGVPKRPALVMDSTVVVRYGLKRAGAERGYNPKKRGRPSHHPLPAFVRETGDCLGVRWRAGNAHTAGGGGVAGRVGGAPAGLGSGGRHGAARQGLLQPEDGADAGGTGRLLPAQGSPPPLVARPPGPVALLGQG